MCVDVVYEVCVTDMFHFCAVNRTYKLYCVGSV